MIESEWRVATAGALVRGRFRRHLARSGLEYKEVWGLVESVFRLYGPPEQLDQLRREFPGD